MSKSPHKSEQLEGLQQKRRMLLSSPTIISLLILIIVAELITFGLGLNARLSSYISRIELAQQQEMELALVRAAEIEAESLAALIPNKGAATVGKMPEMHDASATEGSNSAPDLRPRDIDTIIDQETDALLDDLTRELEAEQAAITNSDSTDDNGPHTTPAANSTKDSKELDRLIRQGISALVAGDMRRCILSFEQALTINPKHPALLYYYGMAYDKLLNPNKAREYYTELYQMRNAAGKYFDRAAKRLTYGFSTPAAMRGKLAFGPHFQRSNTLSGDEVTEVIIPVLLANDEELNPEDIYIHIQFFDLKQGKTILMAQNAPILTWENPAPSWEEHEEKLIAQYTITSQEKSRDIKQYYGFTAKLYYKGEPLDCISYPAALILHEQRLNRQNGGGYSYDSLLPDDGLDPSYEEAIPFSETLY